MTPWFWTFGLQNTERINFYYCACMLSRFSCVQLFATKWTIACHVSLSMGFSRQEYWSGLPCPPPGDFSWPRDRTRISYVYPPWRACSLPLVPPGKPSIILSHSFCGNLPWKLLQTNTEGFSFIFSSVLGWGKTEVDPRTEIKVIPILRRKRHCDRERAVGEVRWELGEWRIRKAWAPGRKLCSVVSDFAEKTSRIKA